MGKRRGHVVHGGVKVDALPSQQSAPEHWTPPIRKCVATRKEGITEVLSSLASHHVWLESTEAGRARRHERLREEVRETLREALIDAATRSLAAEIDEVATSVESRATDLYTAIESRRVWFTGAR